MRRPSENSSHSQQNSHPNSTLSLSYKHPTYRARSASKTLNNIPKAEALLSSKGFQNQTISKFSQRKIPAQSYEVIKGVEPCRTLQFKARSHQKQILRSIEEEHSLISRQNMQLLGLHIQKVSYSQKSKAKYQSGCSIVQGLLPQMLIGGSLFVPEDLSKQLDKRLDQNSFQLRRPSTAQRQNKLKEGSEKTKQATSRPNSGQRKRSLRRVSNQYVNLVYESRFLSYQELLFRLQWSYGVWAGMDMREGEWRGQRRLKVWIGGGNNSTLIRQLMGRRYWWQIVQQRTSDTNFVWTQLKIAQLFVKQPQAALWIVKNKIKTEQKDTVTQALKSKKNKRPKQQPEEDHLHKLFYKEQEADFRNATRGMLNKQFSQRISKLKLREVTGDGQRMHNHLPNNFYLGNKKALYYSLKEYYQLAGGELFSVIPLTFHIREGLRDPQFKRFQAYHRKRAAVGKSVQAKRDSGQQVRPVRNIWIVKPGQITNRGNGITVIDQIYQLQSMIKSTKTHNNGSPHTFIVQLYIDRPFLYKRRKFDIRHYLLVSQLHGVFRAYWYAQGYIRTSSYEFNIECFQRQIHLTNDAVQKHTTLYGRYQPGNKVSYADFQKYLDVNYPKNNYNFQQQVLAPMKTITLDVVRSVFVKLSPQRLQHNFQIFGLDFMVDHEFRPWLIEVNTNPCLQLSSPLLSRIIPQMVDQSLRLTLDVIYPPPGHYPNTNKHLVPDASLQNLKFDLLFDERVQGTWLRSLYRKSKSNLLEQIGDVSDDEQYQQAPNISTAQGLL